jgi:hypothetical protein
MFFNLRCPLVVYVTKIVGKMGALKSVVTILKALKVTVRGVGMTKGVTVDKSCVAVDKKCVSCGDKAVLSSVDGEYCRECMQIHILEQMFYNLIKMPPSGDYCEYIARSQ